MTSDEPSPSASEAGGAFYLYQELWRAIRGERRKFLGSGAGKWLALSLVIASGAWLLHGPGRLLERAIALTVRQRMSALLIERLTDLLLSWHESHHSGATAHRVQQSTIALMQFAQSQFIYLNSAVRLVGPLGALWLLAPPSAPERSPDLQSS